MKQSNNNIKSSSITTDWMSQLVTLPQLLDMDFPPPSWLVPNVIPQGLTLLAGRPKAGKSFFALEVSLAVASGGYAFGSNEHQCGQGKVLYCALEDTLSRLQRRVQGLLDNRVSPTTNLVVTNQLPKMDEGGIESLNTWYQAYPDARLIVVDVLSKFKSHNRRQRGGTLYDQEYDVLSPLQEFTLQNNVSVFVVHHLTKRVNPDDVFDEISGSTALSAVPDTLLVLKRIGNNATLHIKGRDIEQQQLGFVSEAVGDMCSWQLVGEVSEEQVSRERRDIIDLLDEYPSPLGPKDIAEKLDKSRESIRKMLHQMANQQDPAIEKVGQGNQTKYTIMGNGNTGNRVTPDVMGNGNSGNSREIIPLGGNSTGNTYIHEEPSGSQGSSQAVTGVTAVTNTIDEDLSSALKQVPDDVARQTIQDVVATGEMEPSLAILVCQLINEGKIPDASKILVDATLSNNKNVETLAATGNDVHTNVGITIAESNLRVVVFCLVGGID